MKQLFLVLIPLLLMGAPLDSLLLKDVQSSDYEPQTIGFALYKAGDSLPIAELNSKTSFIPASVQKLFTGGAAMDILSPLHDFKTEVYVDSLDRLSGKVIGNIYVKGHGDPGFTAEQLWLLAYHLKMEGISYLGDTLFVDNSYFDTVSIGPGFGDKLSSRAYMAPVAPLSVNFNAIAVHVRPTIPGQPAEISYLPPRAGQKENGMINTVANGVSSGVKVSTYEQSDKSIVSLKGTINQSDKSRTIYRKVWNPIDGFSGSFIAACEQVGITCSLTVLEGSVKDKLKGKPFYTFSSQPLQRHIRNMFKYSNNFIAEMIFRSIHSETKSVSGSWDGGAALVTEWWKGIAEDTTYVPTVINGSGMGTGNRCTPRSVIDVLESALKQPRWSAEFISALPVAGEDGTLGKRFKKSPLKGVMRAKTGTLNNSGVSNLAGYIFKDGEVYSFVFFVNNTKKGQYSHWQLHEKVLTTLYNNL